MNASGAIALEWFGGAAFVVSGAHGTVLLDPPVEDGPNLGRFEPQRSAIALSAVQPYGGAFEIARRAGRAGIPLLASRAVCDALERGADGPQGRIAELVALASGAPAAAAGFAVAAFARPAHAALVVEGEGFRLVHVAAGIAGPEFETIRERGAVDVALLPGWDPAGGRTPLETLAYFRVMCDVLRPRAVFPHAPYDPDNRFYLDVKADFARSGQGATVAFAPPGVRLNF